MHCDWVFFTFSFITQPATRGPRLTLRRLKWSQARGRLNLCAECAGSACWVDCVRRDLSGTLCSASLCQTEVQRCLIWLRSLFVQAVSGILTDLRQRWILFFFPPLQFSFSYLFYTFANGDTQAILVCCRSTASHGAGKCRRTLFPLTFSCLLCDLSTGPKITLWVRAAAGVQRGYQHYQRSSKVRVSAHFVVIDSPLMCRSITLLRAMRSPYGAPQNSNGNLPTWQKMDVSAEHKAPFSL